MAACVGEKVVTPITYVANESIIVEPVEALCILGGIASQFLHSAKTSPFKCPTLQCAITFCHSSE